MAESLKDVAAGRELKAAFAAVAELTAISLGVWLAKHVGKVGKLTLERVRDTHNDQWRYAVRDERDPERNRVNVLAENAAAVEARTAAKLAKRRVRKAATAAARELAGPAEPKPSQSVVTRENVKEALTRYALKYGEPAGKALLLGIGAVDRLADLEPRLFTFVIAATRRPVILKTADVTSPAAHRAVQSAHAEDGAFKRSPQFRYASLNGVPVYDQPAPRELPLADAPATDSLAHRRNEIIKQLTKNLGYMPSRPEVDSILEIDKLRGPGREWRPSMSRDPVHYARTPAPGFEAAASSLIHLQPWEFRF